MVFFIFQSNRYFYHSIKIIPSLKNILTSGKTNMLQIDMASSSPLACIFINKKLQQQQKKWKFGCFFPIYIQCLKQLEKLWEAHETLERPCWMQKDINLSIYAAAHTHAQARVYHKEDRNVNKAHSQQQIKLPAVLQSPCLTADSPNSLSKR